MVIFSGNAELALKKQTQECLDNREFEEFYKQHLIQNCNVPEDLVEDVWESRKQKVSKNFQVVWGTEGAKHCTPKKRTLFIWDESHFAQDKKMCPDKFLETMGILPNGDFRRLTDSDNYVLSVSATPFSEICDIQHQSQGKMVIPFVPGDCYMGVQRMWESGMIIQYNDTKEEARKQMTDLTRFEGNKKIGIIRIPKSSKKETTESYERVFTQMANQLGYDVFLYYEAENEEQKEDQRRITNTRFLELLDQDNMTRNALILIKEHCRMGQVLKKKNISFVMETSNNSRTDVVLQGLLGRMCGYDGNSLIRVCLKNSFFAREVIAKDEKTGMPIYGTNELEKYIEFTQQLQRRPVGSLPSVMPIHSRNLVQEKSKKIYRELECDEECKQTAIAGGGSGYGQYENQKGMFELTPIIPIKLPESVKLAAMTRGRGLGPIQIQEIQDIFERSSNLNQEDVTQKVREQILENAKKYKSTEISTGLFESLAMNERSANKIHESIRTQFPSKMGSSNGFKQNVIGIFYAYDDFKEYGIMEGDAFLWMQYENKDKPRETILPKTTEKELVIRIEKFSN